MTLRLLCIASLAAACTPRTSPPADAGYAWQLPAGFPTPVVPADNPMSEAKVTLGRHLFYDARLSWPKTRACSTCHQQAYAFTVPAARGAGLSEPTRHNPMALNVPAYQAAYLWGDSSATSLEAVLAETLTDENELAGAGHQAEILARLLGDARYPPLFDAAFPEQPASYDLVAKALASFVRTIVSGNSPYDRAQRGDASALSASALRGRDLFFSERTECYHCHAGFTFSSAVNHQGLAVASLTYSNTGLYDLDGQGTYPAGDHGLIEVTRVPADMGKFKAPSLRNIAKSGPYQHDGSMATLREVIDAYVAGGRSALDGGAVSPLCDALIQGRLTAGPLDDAEKADLLAFLDALTDEAFLVDPRYADPFQP